MSEVTVKLKDPTRIAWDQGTGLVITGHEPITIEESHFIRAKINEGVLVEVQPENKATEPPTPPKEPPTEPPSPPAETPPAEPPAEPPAPPASNKKK